MSLLQKEARHSVNTRESELAKSALRLLPGGVIFAVVRTGNILVILLTHTPTMNTNLSSELTGVAFGLSVLDGILITAVISFLAARLPYQPLVRFFAIFVPFFWIYAGSNTLELMFFSTYGAPAVIGTWIDTIIVAVLVVGAFVWLLPVLEKYRGAPGLLTILGERPLWSWIWRTFLVGLLYVPTYWTFGALIYPIVKTYYNNPAYGLNLVTPNPVVLLVLELVRGLLYVVALLPVLAVTRGSRWQTQLYVFVFIATFNAWQLVANLTWPAQLRFGHAAEITGDVLIQSLCFCWLLTLKFKQHRSGNAADRLSDPTGTSTTTNQEVHG